MPVTISKINLIDANTKTACERILHSIGDHASIRDSWQTYCQQADSFSLWVGIFNERIIGLILLKGTDVKAFAVHKATQQRGVGRRMAQLLRSEMGALQWPADLKAFGLE